MVQDILQTPAPWIAVAVLLLALLMLGACLDRRDRKKQRAARAARPSERRAARAEATDVAVVG